MTTNTIFNDTLTSTSFHQCYKTAMVSSGQTLLSQGAYQFSYAAFHKESHAAYRLLKF